MHAAAAQEAQEASLISGRDSVWFSNIGLSVVLAFQAVCGLAASKSQSPSSTVADRANPGTRERAIER